MSDNNLDTFLDKFIPPQPEEEEANDVIPEEVMDESTRYKAYKQSVSKAPQIRLLLRWPDGKESAPSYSYIMDLLRPTNEHLYLICTNYVIVLSGRNLGALMLPLKEHLIEQIQCFVATKWMPPDENEPIITNISYETMAVIESMNQ